MTPRPVYSCLTKPAQLFTQVSDTYGSASLSPRSSYADTTLIATNWWPKHLGGNHMKRVLALVLAAAAIGGALPGCAYGSIATAGDKVVITRQDGFLFGALRKVFVCKVTDGGAASCHDQDSP
jgi:hypothetical protein